MVKDLVKFLVLFFIVSSVAGIDLLYAEEESPNQRDLNALFQLASEEEQALEKSGLIYDDTELKRYLDGIVQRLRPADFRGELSFTVKVLRDPHPNAFVFPDGAIYINTGMLARIENEAQLATILAHEMAHAMKRHALENYLRLKRYAASFANVMERFRKSGERGAVNGFKVLRKSSSSEGIYSRMKEQEADRVGFEIMVQAGYNPEEGIEIFRDLEQEMAEEKILEPFVSEGHSHLRDRMHHFQAFLNFPGKAGMSGIRNRKVFLLKTKDALLENARLDLKLGRFTTARRETEKYLEVFPFEAKAFYLMGEIARLRGKDGDIHLAKGFYEKAISLNPSYPEPYRALGLIYYKAGQMRLAGKSFQWCLLLSPHRRDKAYIQSYLRKCRESEAGRAKGS